MRGEIAQTLLARGCIISVQVLNEFANVARRKLNMNWQELREALNAIRALCGSVLPLEIETHLHAMELSERYGLSIFDASVVASALRNGCKTLWSEDMQNGLIIESRLKIENPFAAPFNLHT